MHRAGLLGWAMAGLLLAWTPLAKADVPDVVRQIPADAQIFVAARSLSATAAKLKMLDQRLGLGLEQLQNALPLLKQQAGVERGLDDSGGVALAVFQIEQMMAAQMVPPPGGDPNAMTPPVPPILVIAAVSDYAAFAGNFGAAAGPDVSQGQYRNTPVYLKRSGNYAVIGPKRELVAAYAPPAGDNGFAASAGRFGSDILDRSDLMAYVNFQALEPLRGMMQMGMEMGRMQMQQQIDAGLVPEAQAKMMQKMIDFYFAAIDAFMRDAESGLAGIDLNESGAGISYAAKFKDGSTLADLLSGEGGGELKLDHLPARPYLFAASTDLRGLPLSEWGAKFTELFADGDDPFSQMMKSVDEIWDAIDGRSQQAWYVPGPNANPMTGFFNSVTYSPTSDPQKVKQVYRKMMEAMGSISFGEGDQEVGYIVSYEQNVMQVGGRSVDKMSMRMKIPPEVQAQMGPAAAFMAMDYGGYVVTLDDAMVIVQGGDQSLLEEAVAVATAGNGKLDSDPGIVAVRDNLTADRVMEVHFGIGGAMQVAGGLMAMFMPDAEFKAPENLPPVSMSASIRDGAVGARVFMPMGVALAAADIARQFGLIEGEAPPAVVVTPEADERPTPVEPLDLPELNITDPSSGRPLTINPRPVSTALVELSGRAFIPQVLKADGPVTVTFTAAESEPSEAQGHILSDLADQFRGKVRVCRLDVASSGRVAQLYAIDQAPTTVVFYNGQTVGRFVGLTGKDRIEAVLQQLTAR